MRRVAATMLHGVTLTQLTICQECGKLEIHTAPL